MLCIPQQLVERRAGAGGDDIERLMIRRFHAGVANFEVQPQSSAHLREKRAFLGDGFEQRDLYAVSEKLCQNDAGETAAAAEIGEGSSIGRDILR